MPHYGGGTGSPELGVLGVNSSGKLAIQVRDSGDAGFIGNIFPLGSAWEAADMLVAGDADGDGAPEVSILAVRKVDGIVVLQTRAAIDDALIGNVFLP
jgi:hypothetical protein